MPGKKRKTIDDRVLVVGIDFGTTHSGVAWQVSTKDAPPNTVMNWKSQLPFTMDKSKVPTDLVRGRQDRPPSWGYDVPSTASSAKYFKLLLINEDDLGEHLHQSYPMRQARKTIHNASPMDVTAEYLGLLWEHAMERVKCAIGDITVDDCPIRVVVTLPAIWPVYAQARMYEAVRRNGILDDRPAGQTSLSFVSEPEAAAIATLHDLSDSIKLQANDHFVVCDAGGGTVDVIAYKVAKLSPLRVKESVPGSGDVCGSIFLDEQFRRLLREVLGHDIMSQMGDEGLEELMHISWENGIKRAFSGKPTEIFQLRIHPEEPGPNTFRSFKQNITYEMLMFVFDSIIKAVECLVLDQISAVRKKHGENPKYVILVGGFGTSAYLFKRLKERVGQNTQVLQASGDQPWSAISRGAVFYGLAQENSPAALGLAEANEHLKRDKVWCPVQQQFLAVDQTKWFLQLGDAMKENTPIKHSFWQDLEEETDEIVTELVYSESANPPNRCDETVRRLCMVKWTKVPDFSSLPFWRDEEGAVIRQICYEVQMTVSGALMSFSIIYKGEQMGGHDVVVDFSNSGALFHDLVQRDSGATKTKAQ